MAHRHEFVVIGAGLVGLEVTRELARRGRDVVCLEREKIGHDRAGSKGAARIFRFGYDDPFYVRLAMRSLVGWRQLSEESGEQLVEPAGLLSFGERLRELVGAMEDAGASSELVVGEELAERFPSFEVPGPAVYEATAGVLRADRILAELATSARASGAGIVEGARVTRFEVRDHGVAVEATDGVREGRVVVLCGGASSGELAAAAGLDAGGVFRPTLQQVAYLEPKDESPRAEPAFVWRGPVTYYGLPTLGRYKIGIHDPGPSVDVSEVSLDPDEAAVELLRAAAEQSLPGFHPVPVATERCFYDNTADEDFVIDRVGRFVVGGGTSGHGFKFGPVWGEVLADLAEGTVPQLRLDRFSLARRR